MDRKRATSRRKFLKSAGVTAAAIATPCIVPGAVFGANAPSNRITMGFVGLGRGEGFVLHYSMRPEVKILAVCDVAKGKRDGRKETVDAAYGNKDCAAYGDFRDLIARDDIDTVMVYTPTHWHAVISVAALNAGKDVFCEKPMALTVKEGRAVCDAVKRNNRVFLAGTQYRTYPDWQAGVEVVRNGMIGKLKRVMVLGSPGIYKDADHTFPASVRPPPDLDYDMWLGPSPEVPYFGQFVGSTWMACADYATGWLTEFGVHSMDNALWGYNPAWEGIIEVEGKGNYYHDPRLDTLLQFEAELRFPDGVTMPLATNLGEKGCRGFTTFVGTDGWVGMSRVINSGEPMGNSSPLGLFRPDSTQWRANQELVGRDFIDCVRSRRTPYATAESCHRATSLLLVADIAMRLGRKLKWDPVKEEFLDDETANRLLSRPMRSPWRLVGV
ncbi:MAG: Gfo/Idh/MocA family oxidoreductase [Thermoguttaceae bacterium]|jgi:predicted dehydrogenase